MESRAYRRLVALSEIHSRPQTTQRSLAERVEASLGLANALLREFGSEDLVSIRPESNLDGARYVLTARGRRELVRLGAALLSESGDLIEPLREGLAQEAGRLRRRGIRKVILFASGLSADLGAAVLRDAGVRVLSVMGDDAAKPKTASRDAVVTLSAEDARAARSLLGRRTRIVQLTPRHSSRESSRG